MPKLSLLMPALAALLAVSPARAFHNESEFARGGEFGGGGGLSFTGSRRANGFDCAICHVEPERRMFMTIASHPEGLTTDGRYVPGETYHLVIRMHGEHRNVDGNLNRNTFMLEILDDEDEPAGAYHHPSEPTAEVEDDRLLAGRGAVSNATEWDVEWTAPTDAGALTVFLAGVDGDGAEGGRLAPDGDPWNDDVFAGSLRLLPVGAPAEPLAASGCSVAPPNVGGAMMWSWGLAFGLFAWGARRRRRHAVRTPIGRPGRRAPALGVSLWCLCLLGVGCTDPEMVVDCTRTLCAPDGAGADIDAGPHHTEVDSGMVFPEDGGAADAGPHHVEHDGGGSDAGAACEAGEVVVEPGGRFCMDSCYCRTSQTCVPVAGAEGCCADAPVCPEGGARFAGCAPRSTILVGDAPGCAHGQCYCGSDDRCYATRTAPGCCAGEIRCF